MTLHSTARSGGIAPGLPGDTLTRRSALRGSAAAAIALAAGVGGAQPAAASEAALIALARRLEILIADEREAWSRHADAEDAALTASPPTPIRRESLRPYAGLDALPPADRFAKLMADPVEAWSDSDAADREHRDAVAEHTCIVAAIEKQHGVPRLRGRASRLTDKVEDASENLAEMRATTSAGLGAKAHVLLVAMGGDPHSRSAELDRHAELLDSLLQEPSGPPGYFIRPPKGHGFGAGYHAVMDRWWDAIEACPDHVERVVAHVSEHSMGAAA